MQMMAIDIIIDKMIKICFNKSNQFYYNPLTLYSFTLLLTICFYSTKSYRNPLSEFSKYEIVFPKLHPQHRDKRENHVLINQKKHQDNLRITLKAFNQSFILNLQLNAHLISPNYIEKHRYNGKYITSRLHNDSVGLCHYQGKLLNNEFSWAAISTCYDSISGVFSDGNDSFYLHPNENNKNIILFRDKDLNSSQFKCGSRENSIFDFRRLSKRSVREPYKSKTRYIELVLVNDFQLFIENKQNRDVLFDRSKRIANIINALYNQLNIFIALTGVVVWTEANEISLSSDADQTLTNFLKYRREKLIPEQANDVAQLITGLSFDGGIVGKALKGTICTYEYSGGVNTDHSQVIGLVATTVAHVLGHNLGMEHDTSLCSCPDDKCIMAASSRSVSPKHWSSCSREHLEDAFRHGMDHCLHNVPQELFGPICGNGFVEVGEECDCGLKEYCNDTCCNSTTCKFFTGAKCANGPCCDTSTCQVVAAETHKVCRQPKSECDLPEFCDGIHSFCPEDLHVQDGTQCLNGSAFCYSGRCDSHDTQCKLLWGESGEASHHKCYAQNIRGNANGNCGYFQHNQTFISCNESHVICGRLHCIHQNEKLEYGMESAAILSRSFINIKGKILACRSAIIDLGLDSIDPGLVPNGAKCGPNSMCVHQRCVPVSTFLSQNSCHQNCNNNGACDKKGSCHCFPGYAPPHCEYSFSTLEETFNSTSGEQLCSANIKSLLQITIIVSSLLSIY